MRHTKAAARLDVGSFNMRLSSPKTAERAVHFHWVRFSVPIVLLR